MREMYERNGKVLRENKETHAEQRLSLTLNAA